MSWVIKQFKDVVQFPPKITLEKGKSYSFIPMEDLSSGVKYVSPKTEKVWLGSGGAKFEDGDTLFARITPCLQNGKISQAKNLKNGKGFGSTEFFIFRGIENISDSDFIYYFALNEEFKKYAIGSMVGASGRQRADQKFVGEFEINLPPLETQKRIASILSTYDDLIENNLKRIKLLEETAQNIYKEWFVNFRFPNYEHTAFDAESGLPKGWEKINLYDFAEIKMGFPFKAEDFNEGNFGKPAIRIRDIPSSWTRTYTTQEVSEDYLVEQGDILIGMDGFFYLDIWRGQKGYLVQRVCRLRAIDENLQGFLLEALRQPISYYEKTISGATVAHLGAKHLKEIFINVPKDGQLLEDMKIFNRLNSQKINFSNQNQKLKEARDILLPRLMNRTIEV